MANRDLIARLAALSSCDIADALDHLGLEGAVLGIHSVSVMTRIAGQVHTDIDSASPGDVIVYPVRGRMDAGVSGGKVARVAKAKGIVAFVVDGTCRDLDELRDLNFPVFARGVVPVSSRGRVPPRDPNEPMEIEGVIIRQGDLVIADGSGVVFIPKERAEEIISIAEEIADHEAEMNKLALSGYSLAEVMRRTHEWTPGLTQLAQP